MSWRISSGDQQRCSRGRRSCRAGAAARSGVAHFHHESTCDTRATFLPLLCMELTKTAKHEVAPVRRRTNRRLEINTLALDGQNFMLKSSGCFHQDRRQDLQLALRRAIVEVQLADSSKPWLPSKSAQIIVSQSLPMAATWHLLVSSERFQHVYDYAKLAAVLRLVDRQQLQRQHDPSKALLDTEASSRPSAACLLLTTLVDHRVDEYEDQRFVESDGNSSK